MGGSEIIAQLLVYMVVLLFAVSAHEAAHAWMSDKFGDDTARLLGRVTLNPVAHTDPLGTLVLPIASFLLSAVGGALGSIPLIGWGKPTPINPLLWRKKDLANVMVSAAGIMANILIAITFIIIFKILLRTSLLYQGGSLESVAEPIVLFMSYMIYMNASLAVFNLLPFPPLDGSKILETFLPASMQPVWEMLEQYGFIILMAVIYFGLLRAIFTPIRRFIDFLIFV
ncbi:MAG: site-2 protease family protein [Pyrinomonadaceae bacterium]|nr:site-2 protease family protein [Pyrinomonadaceae bacterium]